MKTFISLSVYVASMYHIFMGVQQLISHEAVENTENKYCIHKKYSYLLKSIFALNYFWNKITFANKINLTDYKCKKKKN